MDNEQNIVEIRNVHVVNLLRWLFNEVISAGGDGDAFWYTRYYNLEYISDIIKKLNVELQIEWSIEDCMDPQGRRYLSWGQNQEYIIITCDKEMWENRPFYTQCSIQW